MGRKRIEVYILTVIFLAVGVFFGVQDPENSVDLFFVAQTEVHEEEIRLWESVEGKYIAFLPSYVNLEQLKIHTRRSVFFDDMCLNYGATCGDLELNRDYVLSGNGYSGTITLMQSENLPTIYIDTASGAMETIHASKENEEAGHMRLYNEQGKLEAWSTLESIKSRGNASFYESKKPYNLKLPSEQDLLGMGAAQKWILLANAYDKTHLKNKVVYDFAAEAGLPFSPKSRWVDVYLNGDYAGLYLLCEHNEVHRNRVNLPGGGFLVSKEQPYNVGQSTDSYFITNAGAVMRLRYHSIEESAVKDIFQSAENAILADDGVDPVTGKHWTELIDLDSWARKYLVEEIFGGVDAGIASQYFYYQPESGKIYAGPVWDYDGSMSRVIGISDDMPVIEQIPEMFYAHRNRETPWFHKLYYNDFFYARLTELYRETFFELLETYVDEKIPKYAEQIQQAAQLNKVRWNHGDPQGAAAYVCDYLTNRMNFLTDVWDSNKDYIEVHVDYTYDGLLCRYMTFDYAITPGSCLPEIPIMGPYTWYITGTDIPFDNAQPICEEMGIELRES